MQVHRDARAAIPSSASLFTPPELELELGLWVLPSHALFALNAYQ